jgi:hypothetical protein
MVFKLVMAARMKSTPMPPARYPRSKSAATKVEPMRKIARSCDRHSRSDLLRLRQHGLSPVQPRKGARFYEGEHWPGISYPRLVTLTEENRDDTARKAHAQEHRSELRYYDLGALEMSEKKWCWPFNFQASSTTPACCGSKRRGTGHIERTAESSLRRDGSSDCAGYFDP